MHFVLVRAQHVAVLRELDFMIAVLVHLVFYVLKLGLSRVVAVGAPGSSGTLLIIVREL